MTVMKTTKPFAETMLMRGDSSLSLESTDSQHVVSHGAGKTTDRKPQHVEIDSTPISPPSSSMKGRKTVQFNDYDEVVEIKHLSDFSKRRIAATYWSSKERDQFRQDALRLIHDAEEDPAVYDADEFRGLEQHTDSYSEQCRKNVDRIYDIVCECQSYEDEEGIPVPAQVMADFLYDEVSKHTALAARLRAVQDEVDALKC